jgi:hypothetical protein
VSSFSNKSSFSQAKSQIKMKKLELEQFMLSKEKKERVPLVLPSSTK